MGTAWGQPGDTAGFSGLGRCWGPRMELTQLLDAFLVLDEELHPRDVDVQSGSLGGALHRRVKAAVILAVR